MDESGQIYSIFGKEYPLPLYDNRHDTRAAVLLYATLMFAERGYSGFSMRDLADKVGIKTASLYYHFPGKDELWDAVIKHIESLYSLYLEHLNSELLKATGFEEILHVIFHEPRLMQNRFTCFGFGMMMNEQFYREDAWAILCRTFYQGSFLFYQKWFDRCVEREYVRPFDTRSPAVMLVHTIMCAEQTETQRLLGRRTPYDSKDLMAQTEKFLLETIGGR